MKIKLLAVLTPEERKSVKGLASNKTSVLFKRNELCQNLGFVISGQVQVIVSSPNGNDVLYQDLHAGDIFGNDALFSDNGLYKGDVIAIGKTTVGLIDKEKVVELLSSNKGFLEEYLRIQSEKISSLTFETKILDSENVEDRLLAFINMNGRNLKMKSIQDVANKIHVSREALSREIKKLVNNGVISKENNVLKILK